MITSNKKQKIVCNKHRFNKHTTSIEDAEGYEGDFQNEGQRRKRTKRSKHQRLARLLANNSI